MRKVKFEVGMQVNTPNGNGKIETIISNNCYLVDFGSNLFLFFNIEDMTPIKE